jgi:pentose-5-phosphate-3-epimerase
MITFTPQVVREKVVLDGKVIGIVFPYESDLDTVSKYQAQLQFISTQAMYPGGFGPTKIDAITDAIANGREEALKALAELAEIEAKI